MLYVALATFDIWCREKNSHSNASELFTRFTDWFVHVDSFFLQFLPTLLDLNKANIFDICQHRGEAVLRKHLRTFEENQINIIRKTKGKRRLKFHQFYSAKKYPKGYA